AHRRSRAGSGTTLQPRRGHAPPVAHTARRGAERRRRPQRVQQVASLHDGPLHADLRAAAGAAAGGRPLRWRRAGARPGGQPHLGRGHHRVDASVLGRGPPRPVGLHGRRWRHPGAAGRAVVAGRPRSPRL
ncbi:MAG: hypothetical protein AVDCRST_MAG50-3126, partial [uncultured Acidimicrobiales bacterium]